MNYYKQGNAANADKINAAFKKLGYDTSGHLFNAKSVLYFTLDGEIRATTCNCTPAIIKTHPGYKCCYGNFEEMILSPKHARQIYNLYRFLNRPNLEANETMREKDEIDQAFTDMMVKGGKNDKHDD